MLSSLGSQKDDSPVNQVSFNVSVNQLVKLSLSKYVSIPKSAYHFSRLYQIRQLLS